MRNVSVSGKDVARQGSAASAGTRKVLAQSRCWSPYSRKNPQDFQTSLD